MATISISPATSPAVTPRDGASSPVKRTRALLSEEISFKPVSMHPAALKVINTAAEKQLEKGKADLDAALAALRARRISSL